MLRSMLCSLVLLCVFSLATIQAAAPANAVGKDDKKAKEAKITKIDAKKKTVTLKMHGDEKADDKDFTLAEEIEYMDSTGKVATIEIFTLGDEVAIVEVDGKISSMKKCDKTEKKKPEAK